VLRDIQPLAKDTPGDFEGFFILLIQTKAALPVVFYLYIQEIAFIL